MVSVKSRSINGGFCPSVEDYSVTLSVLISLTAKRCSLHEQRVYASQKVRTEEKLFNSFLPIPGDSDCKEGVLAGKVPLLFVV